MLLDAKVSEELGLGRHLAPVDLRLHLLRLLQRLPLLVDEGRVILLANLCVLFLDVIQVALLLRREHGAHDCAAARGIEHMDHPVLVLWRELDRSVALGGCGAADHKRLCHALLLHLLCHVHHLVERGSDEAGETDDIHILLDGPLEDLLTGNHDAHVDDLVVVAPEHHTNNVLPDVVDVALDGGHQHDAVPLRLVGILAGRQGSQALLLLHEGRQVPDGLLHDPRTLNHLGQEHLPRAEEVADDAHALHQRPLDDMQRDLQVRACLLHVTVDELVDAVDKAMLETLGVGAIAPRILALRCGSAASRGCRRWRRLLYILRELKEPLHVLAVCGPVENHILTELPRLLINVRVPWQATRVDNGHVEALRHGVVQEDSVHGITDGVQAAEGEGEVAEASAEGYARARALNLCHRIDEV
mmetsp:Transcript_72770/g.206517  ORF Transcript_72770/g.206517 Transcript_72770/m.206517 type:complete len:416 (+) Transcript_72770:1155-2402(+)